MAVSDPAQIRWGIVTAMSITNFAQGVFFTLPFAVAPFMVRAWEARAGVVDEQAVGRYTGLLAGTYALAQCITQLPWGAFSDARGRKPVMLIASGTLVASSLMFGLAGGFWAAAAARALGGLLNGVPGAWKCILAEGFSASDAARVMSFFTLSWGVGSITGPALGGALSVPCDTFAGDLPGCGPDGLLRTRPYVLPCIAAALLNAGALIAQLAWLEETLPSIVEARRRAHRRARKAAREPSGTAPPAARAGLAAWWEGGRELLRSGSSGLWRYERLSSASGDADALPLAQIITADAGDRGLVVNKPQRRHSPALTGLWLSRGDSLPGGQPDQADADAGLAAPAGLGTLSPEPGAAFSARSSSRLASLPEVELSELLGGGARRSSVDADASEQQPQHAASEAAGAAEPAAAPAILPCSAQRAHSAAISDVSSLGCGAADAPLPPWHHDRQVVAALAGFTAVCLLHGTLDELFPIFASAPITSGGLGMSEAQVAAPLAWHGFCLILWAMLCYPPAQRAIGTLPLTRLSLVGFAPTAMLVVLPSLPTAAGAKELATILLLSGMSLKSAVMNSSFNGAVILVNAKAARQQLGKVNAVGSVLATFVRSIGPLGSGLMWASALQLRAPGVQQFLPFAAVAVLGFAAAGVYMWVTPAPGEAAERADGSSKYAPVEAAEEDV